MYSPASKPGPLKRLVRVCLNNKWLTLILVLGSYQLFTGGYIYAKAAAAQWLIKDAWLQTLETNQPVKPWTWADTWPVAKLVINNQNLYVLAGASGRNLAFGPTHLSQTPLPGQAGNVAIAGHRDTHFSLLREVEKGDLLRLEGLKHDKEYRVSEIRIVHESETAVLNNNETDVLTLITCYPFDSVAENPELRYVVRGRAINEEHENLTHYVQ